MTVIYNDRVADGLRQPPCPMVDARLAAVQAIRHAGFLVTYDVVRNAFWTFSSFQQVGYGVPDAVKHVPAVET